MSFLSSLWWILVLGALPSPLALAEHAPPPKAERAAEAATTAKDIPCYAEAVQAAYRLKAQQEKASRQDIELLWDELQERLKKGGIAANDKAFLTVLKAKLTTDREKFTALYKALSKEPSDKRGTPAFSTSLGKFVGMTSKGDRYVGVLEEASKLLEDERLFDRKLSDIELKTKDRTPFKTLLLYASLAAAGADNLNELATCPRFKKLQLIYPTELPPAIAKELAEKTGLFCSGGDVARIQYPNSGYVFGGDACSRGGDCSSFCSEITGSKVRMSTEMMAITVKLLLGGDAGLTEAEKTRYGLMKADVDQVRKEFVAVDFKAGEKPGAGDLVVWRFKKGGGHAAVWDKAIEGMRNRFLAVELNRDDDKTLPTYREGIHITEFDFERPDADVFVLRRRPR